MKQKGLPGFFIPVPLNSLLLLPYITLDLYSIGNCFHSDPKNNVTKNLNLVSKFTAPIKKYQFIHVYPQKVWLKKCSVELKNVTSVRST